MYIKKYHKKIKREEGMVNPSDVAEKCRGNENEKNTDKVNQK